MTPPADRTIDTDQSPVVLSWSGGKDSAMALHALVGSGVEVRALLVTLAGEKRRVSMHGVPEDLVREQARAAGLPLAVAHMPEAAPNDVYRRCFAEALAPFRDVARVAFGDLHLADVRAWREAFMAELGVSAVFPIWGRQTRHLVADFIALGGRAWITCVDPSRLAPAFAGRPLDAATLEALPEGVDPAGENGEFHTFVWDGPWLQRPVACRPAGRFQQGGFAYCDLEHGSPDAAGAP